MSTTQRRIDATPEQVWEVLSDGWLYPLFVVGATRMRDVDDTWPAVGSHLHHSVGTWPFMLDDTTEVIAADAPHRLHLDARGWPFGRAEVVFTLEPDTGGTLVTIEEDAAGGPALLMPKPLRDAQLHVRNVEALQRLAYVVEGRTR